MRKELRQILALEKSDNTLAYAKCAVVYDDEVNACEEKLNVLKDKISKFTCDSSRKKFLVLDSRLSYLMCRFDNIPMTNVDVKTIEVSEQLNVKLKSLKSLGRNDTISFLISDGCDDGEGSDEERPVVSTSTPTRVRDTGLETTNVRRFGLVMILQERYKRKEKNGCIYKRGENAFIKFDKLMVNGEEMCFENLEKLKQEDTNSVKRTMSDQTPEKHDLEEQLRKISKTA
ncbi:hypothetical protein FQA39_LY07545 [Lamprigera yunnana]|nr:hypothetical protein FQA39_LY07545 [Lamprigera yunnana]